LRRIGRDQQTEKTAVSALDEIVDRAIAYTNTLLQMMPSYREAAVGGLRKLRDALAQKSPDDPALEKLGVYIETLAGGASDPGP
jgi:hypothetical protein